MPPGRARSVCGGEGRSRIAHQQLLFPPEPFPQVRLVVPEHLEHRRSPRIPVAGTVHLRTSAAREETSHLPLPGPRPFRQQAFPPRRRDTMLPPGSLMPLRLRLRCTLLPCDLIHRECFLELLPHRLEALHHLSPALIENRPRIRLPPHTADVHPVHAELLCPKHETILIRDSARPAAASSRRSTPPFTAPMRRPPRQALSRCFSASPASASSSGTPCRS